jgi:uncharacterized protein with HEPN domain
MLPLEIRKYLYDILQACNELEAFTIEKSEHCSKASLI